MKPAVNPWNRACKIRMRPDLGSRVIPGWPWSTEAYARWRVHMQERSDRLFELFG